MARSLRTLPVLALGLLATGLAGCGPGNLVDGVSNPLSFGICGLIVIVLDVLALIELVNSGRSQGDKILWAIVIVVFPFVGLLGYYFFARGK